MDAKNIYQIIEKTPQKDTLTTTIKVLSTVYLVMRIIKLGKELTQKEEKKHHLQHRPL